MNSLINTVLYWKGGLHRYNQIPYLWHYHLIFSYLGEIDGFKVALLINVSGVAQPNKECENPAVAFISLKPSLCATDISYSKPSSSSVTAVLFNKFGFQDNKYIYFFLIGAAQC